MINPADSKPDKSPLSRRKFLGVGGALLAGSSMALARSEDGETPEESPEPKIRRYRLLGKTGFKVSDLCMGGSGITEPELFTYAYELGVNYFDTAESYGKGNAERALGEALQSMDREKVFVTTKLHLGDNQTEETVLERFEKCLVRLQTDYVDALLMHSVIDTETLKHPGFHAAAQRLKKAGKLRHIGISNHGPGYEARTSMEDLCIAAAEDGRFDLMLLVYNFLNNETGEKVLAACKNNNLGTVAMKTAPGALKAVPVDPDNLTREQAKMKKRLISYGFSEEQSLKRLLAGAQREKENVEKSKRFVAKHKIKTEDQLQNASIQWILKNPDMHSVCVSLTDFERIDRIIPISGKPLAKADEEFLRDYEVAFGDQYCRHGCNHCADHCPRHLPVSTIMRYAYYFQRQRREKYAMGKYAQLRDCDASLCAACAAPCLKACPYHLDVQGQLLQAHTLLTLA